MTLSAIITVVLGIEKTDRQASVIKDDIKQLEQEIQQSDSESDASGEVTCSRDNKEKVLGKTPPTTSCVDETLSNDTTAVSTHHTSSATIPPPTSVSNSNTSHVSSLTLTSTSYSSAATTSTPGLPSSSTSSSHQLKLESSSDLRAAGGTTAKLINIIPPATRVTESSPFFVYGCYCGDTTPTTNSDRVDLYCEGCKKMFHQRCLTLRVDPSPLPGDWGYSFYCRTCAKSSVEQFHLVRKSWVDIALITFYNLKLQAIQRGEPDRRFFRFKEEICAFIDTHWRALCYGRVRTITWNNTVGSTLSTHSELFRNGLQVVGQSGWWGALDYTNPFLLRLQQLSEYDLFLPTGLTPHPPHTHSLCLFVCLLFAMLFLHSLYIFISFRLLIVLPFVCCGCCDGPTFSRKRVISREGRSTKRRVRSGNNSGAEVKRKRGRPPKHAGLSTTGCSTFSLSTTSLRSHHDTTFDSASSHSVDGDLSPALFCTSLVQFLILSSFHVLVLSLSLVLTCVHSAVVLF